MKSEEHSPRNFTYSIGRIWMKYLFILGGLALVFYSLYVSISSDKNEKKTLWLVDTSLSMVVRDMVTEKNILHSRLEVAQSLILSWRTIIPGNHALMIFWETNQLLLPFSDEASIFSSTVRWLTPTLYHSATDIEGSLSAIDTVYGTTPMDIILLTDGEDTLELDEKGSNLNTPFRNIFIVGIGTPWGWPMLQWYDANGNPRYKQFEWKQAISRLDTDNIQRLTEKYQAQSIIMNTINDRDNFLDSIRQNNSWISHDWLPIMIVWIILLLCWLMVPIVRYR